MKCPYCHKSFKDIPDHLLKKKDCRVAHGNNLFAQLRVLITTHERKYLK